MQRQLNKRQQERAKRLASQTIETLLSAPVGLFTVIVDDAAQADVTAVAHDCEIGRDVVNELRTRLSVTVRNRKQSGPKFDRMIKRAS